MKHRHGNRILSRVASHRRQLLQNLSSSLLEYGSIVTEQAKAKELRRFIEPLITEARHDLTLHRRRRLLSKLARKEDLPRLLSVAEASKNRPGGYTRLTAISSNRSDAARMSRIDLLDWGK
jgi:large subunit ribosomal protein L17